MCMSMCVHMNVHTGAWGTRKRTWMPWSIPLKTFRIKLMATERAGSMLIHCAISYFRPRSHSCIIFSLVINLFKTRLWPCIYLVISRSAQHSFGRLRLLYFWEYAASHLASLVCPSSPYRSLQALHSFIFCANNSFSSLVVSFTFFSAIFWPGCFSPALTYLVFPVLFEGQVYFLFPGWFAPVFPLVSILRSYHPYLLSRLTFGTDAFSVPCSFYLFSPF